MNVAEAIPSRRALVGNWIVDPEASQARFVAGTFAGAVRTPGQFRTLFGIFAVGDVAAAGALVIDASSVDTGNRLRDRHLRSRAFFDARSHPQLRYEPRSISSQDPGRATIDGELIVAGTRTSLPLDVTLDAPTDGVVEVACRTKVDRVALGVRGARLMVPRAVQLEATVTLRRAT